MNVSSSDNDSITPEIDDVDMFLQNQPSKSDYKITRVIEKVGYQNPSKLTKTLQGSIWKAQIPNAQSVCIKVTDQKLYNESAALIDGQLYDVEEDVMMEKSILKYITQQKHCPNSIVKYIDFFKSRSALYFIMEDGGSCLFDFVVRAHNHINAGAIDLAHWKQVVYIIFTQMVEAIEYIHSLNVAHFDISLENWLINDVPINVFVDANGHQKVTFNLKKIQVKLCDFGLAQKFTSDQCISKKFCGKMRYKSPEVVAQTNAFDAKSNDIHCLGICLFTLVTSGTPWKVAHMSDANFAYVTKHSLYKLLSSWKILHYTNRQTVMLMDAMLQSEDKRTNIQKIKSHIQKIPFLSIK